MEPVVDLGSRLICHGVTERSLEKVVGDSINTMLTQCKSVKLILYLEFTLFVFCTKSSDFVLVAKDQEGTPFHEDPINSKSENKKITLEREERNGGQG